MNLQEAFDKAYLGVIEQGGPAHLDDGRCRYRGPNGRKCGVGHLIDDEKLAARWDEQNLGIHVGVQDDKAPAWMKSQPMAQLLTAIQSLHDSIVTELRDKNAGFVDDKIFLYKFKTGMAYRAKQFNLTIPQLEKSE